MQESLVEENAKNVRGNISKIKIVRRVLTTNRNASPSIEELEKKYYRYVGARGY